MRGEECWNYSGRTCRGKSPDSSALLIFNSNSLVDRLVNVVSKQPGWSALTPFALKFTVTPPPAENCVTSLFQPQPTPLTKFRKYD